MANKKSFLNSFWLFLLLSTGFSQIFAQTAGGEFPQSFYDIEAVVFLLLVFFVFFIVMFFGWKKDPPLEENRVTVWQKFKKSMTRVVPVEEEDSILMEDDYDGIKELDNRIPPWFTYLFYATIIFAIGYLLTFHVFKTGKLQAQEYADEMKAAQLQTEVVMNSSTGVNEQNVTLMNDTGSLDAGKTIYKSNCVPCHGPDGGGVVGPNLTDDYWIHGGGIKNIFKTISDGVPAKGMPTWSAQLKPKQVQEVASYVISLHGTHPANAKAPQGQKWEGDKTSN